MSIAATTHVSTSTWATASTASTASSHTPSSDKSSSQSLPRKFARSCTSKIIAPLEIDASFPTIYVGSHAFITLWGSASFQMGNAVFPTRRRWTSAFPVFLT
uniref:Predicted protein n=1 Tax=Hordeum vulgare subsp. vulgare TaxID=112509 RepID=F2E0T4_HORVV|nr:predicted protein [Hordeum vulgare subsp. vulgare]